MRIFVVLGDRFAPPLETLIRRRPRLQEIEQRRLVRMLRQIQRVRAQAQRVRVVQAVGVANDVVDSLVYRITILPRGILR